MKGVATARPPGGSRDETSHSFLSFGAGLVLVSFSTGFALAQDLQKGVPYVCNGERMFIESCNIRDASDTCKCMVGHHSNFLSCL